MKRLFFSFLLAGALLVAATVTATAAVNDTQPRDGPYRSVFEAVMAIPEVEQVKTMLVNFLTSPTGLTPAIVARYQYIIPVAQGKDQNITAFVPLNKAYEDMQLYTCMTTEELNQYIDTHPEVVADTAEQVLANTTKPVSVEDFRDGMKLPTFKKDVVLTLKQRNNTDGTTSWIIPKMNFNRSDIVINTTDIPTGQSILHLTDGIISSDAQQAVYANISKTYCSRPGAKKAAEASIAKAQAARAAQAAASPSPAPVESSPPRNAADNKHLARSVWLLCAAAVLWA